MDGFILSALALGLVMGIKHALDTDHVMAVSNIVGERRGGLLSSAMVGVSWGIGHSATLFLIAIPVLLLRLTVPASLGSFAEAGVGVVLIALGLATLRSLWRKRVHLHVHGHPSERRTSAHLHFHSHLDDVGHDHGHHLALRPRSILIGLLQGTAGSTALMVLVLSTLDSPLAGLIFVAAYDLAVILGILAFSVAISLPFTLTSSRLPLFNKALQLTTAVVSIAVGLTLAWEALLG